MLALLNKDKQERIDVIDVIPILGVRPGRSETWLGFYGFIN